jgi:hypothetical protein
MMELIEGGRRRIDRVLDDSFIFEVTSLPIEGLRERRNLARQEESDLSYLRRMLQGRIEIVELEIESFDHASDESIVDRLTAALTSVVGTAPANARITNSPSGHAQDRRYSERLLNEVGMLEGAAANSDVVSALLVRLRGEERSVSDFRRKVQAVIDVLTHELGDRYRSGQAGPPA